MKAGVASFLVGSCGNQPAHARPLTRLQGLWQEAFSGWLGGSRDPFEIIDPEVRVGALGMTLPLPAHPYTPLPVQCFLPSQLSTFLSPPVLCLPMQLMADSLQSSMGTLVGSPKLPFFLVVPGAAVLTGLLEAGYYCEWAAGCHSERGMGLRHSLWEGAGVLLLWLSASAGVAAACKLLWQQHTWAAAGEGLCW